MPQQKLSVQIENLSQRYKGRDLKLGQLVEELHEVGPWLVCLIMSTPFLLPIPLPGVSTPFGIIILIASFQIAFHANPWIPAGWKDVNVSSNITEKILHKLIYILKKTEKLIKPRFKQIILVSEKCKLSALCLAILALLLALPMPPGFNAPPAIAIISICLANLEEDGLLAAIGMLLTIFNIILFTTFFVIGIEGFLKIINLAN